MYRHYAPQGSQMSTRRSRKSKNDTNELFKRYQSMWPSYAFLTSANLAACLVMADSLVQSAFRQYFQALYLLAHAEHRPRVLGCAHCAPFLRLQSRQSIWQFSGVV